VGYRYSGDRIEQVWTLFGSLILELNGLHYRYVFHLEYMKKNEEALRRLKKGARTGFSLFGSSSTTTQDDASRDEERVRAQMVLDVERLGKDAEAFDVDVGSVQAYVSLVSLAAQSDGG
jgi:conserved oligomeric Golgi complex subunit 2